MSENRHVVVLRVEMEEDFCSFVDLDTRTG